MSVLDKLTDILNSQPTSLRKGDIVIIKSSIIRSKYSNHCFEDPLSVGLLLSNAHFVEDKEGYSGNPYSKICYKKLYSVLIQGIIITVDHADIQERID